MKKPLTAKQMLDLVRPFLPCFSAIIRDSEASCLEAISVLGLPSPVERAGDMHRAQRTHMRNWCDQIAGPIFELVEERDGLDYLVCHIDPENPFAIRTGRFRDGNVRRNDSRRSNAARASGQLSSDPMFGDDPQIDFGSLPHVSLVYEIEDGATPTIAGAAAWHLSKTLLIQEQFDGCEILEKIEDFAAPTNILSDVRRVEAAPKQDKLREWESMFKKAKSG